MEIETAIPFETLATSPNIAAHIPKAKLDEIGGWVVENYVKDKSTRTEWEERSAEAIKLALQVVEQKSFPWVNCSNVKFPLLTVAALQFLARISILTKGRHLVKMESVGPDIDGQKALQAQRISTHMSLQLTDEDVNWIDDDEKAKLSASILGCALKKSYYDPIAGTNISEFVPAMYFVVDYHCKHTDTARRMTHYIPMDANRIAERERRGVFVKMEEAETGTPEANLLKQTADDAEGIKRPQEGDVFEILEQHCWLDLDKDGYAEPYVASVRLDTKQTLRIVARFSDTGDVFRKHDAEIARLEEELEALKAESEGQDSDSLSRQSALEKQIARLESASDNLIVRIDPTQHFTKYTFIPSPDGGFYGLGLGALLGPMNAAVDTLVNQLVDCGTMSTTAGGFLGRGVKIKGGKTSFDPFEWKPVDSTGDDLRKNIVPLMVRDPSEVLFKLLGLLISYGEKIGSSTDIMTGVSPGQNTPAETSRNTVEQGMMLFSGIYARMYRSFREELKKRYELNRLFLSSSPRFAELTQGSSAILAIDDYTKSRFRIFPAADSNAISGQQRKEKAGFLYQLATTAPGFDKYLVTKRLLESWDIEDIDQIYPDPKGPRAIAPPPNPKVEIEKAKLQQQAQEHADQMQLDIVSLKQEIALNEAKVKELEAKAQLHLAEANGIDTGHHIAMIEAQIGAAKARQEGLLGALNTMQKAQELRIKQLASEGQGAKQGPQPTDSATGGNAPATK